MDKRNVPICIHESIDACIHTYIHVDTCIANWHWFGLFGGFFFSVEGQSDGSGEEDISPMGNASDCGLCRFTDQRGASEGSLQQEIDYPSTNLWSNSSRCTAHLSLSLCVCVSLESYMPIAHVRFWIWWSHAFCFPFSFAWYLSLEMQTHVHHFWRIKGFLCQLLLFHFYFNFFPCLACSSFSIFCFGRFSLLRCVIR